ncbi:DUF1599 domain-containing protein [Paracrocinitomix mangrovi]|uniref:DUF1599 domain-containing protein n=1 Tax=Paracrocinitomix mangrovi TaxID=2862509 RepID=UPI001C8EED73|nr:DUF1599 domain-containing protein [Paracrocinitomix mangrovi]UKN01585.1 DUF1599 domain-containing protein [Paracrocinitomix mangrovi]
MSKTADQYKKVIAKCRSIFEKKGKDYGTAWRILRISSLTDQIFIKAQRIRTIQETGVNKVGEDIEGEFIAIVNYCVMGLIQLELGADAEVEMPMDKVVALYDEKTNQAFDLMEKKNHDYGEAWRDMRVSSHTDLIMMKILRTKQIEDNDGKTLISEGIDANYLDMLNYAVFALILLDEQS